MGALHGVDGHFDLAPLPVPAGSGSLASLSIGISVPELTACAVAELSRRWPLVPATNME
jgi:hypothetical protein